MERVFICTDNNGKYLGVFNSDAIARGSWQESYSRSAPAIVPEFKTTASPKTEVHWNGDLVGFIQSVPVLDHVEHL